MIIRRWRPLWPIVATFLSAVVVTSCNHRRPFYGSTEPRPSAPPRLAEARIVSRLLLIGDAGEPARTGEPVLQVLADTVANLPERTRVVFLGDNVYPAGFTPSLGDMSGPERRLQAQIDAVGSVAEGIFIPGNHDWDNAGPGGLEAIQNQAAYLAASPSRVRMIPEAGCPGPVDEDLNGLQLVSLDTQWWLHDHARLEAGCPVGPDTAAVSTRLRTLMSGNGSKRIVVGHHPLQTAGPHGGFFPWTTYVFPLTMHDGDGLWRWIPLQIAAAAAVGSWSTAAGIGVGVIGSVLIPVARWTGISRQDLASRHYDGMADQLEGAFSTNPPLVYAAGHDHGLQVLCGLPGQPIYQLVSGLGSSIKAGPVGDTPNTLFAHSSPGFMALDLLEDESVLLRVIETGADGVVYWRWLAKDGRPVECEPAV